MSQQIFRTNPVKRILIYLCVIVAVFVFTSIFLTAERFKVFYWAINILTFAICLLLIIFETDTTIICDEIGCDVKKKTLWGSFSENYGFKWSEVSETEYFADAESSREFYVEINGVKRKILTTEFSLNDFDYFIETVNQATPHLPYIWQKNDGLVASTFEGRRYGKISR
ncbi:MAG TPA: hypothetical protein PKE69_02900 [Pyrinomonadaceae bacterium]|nr:hypothetical protein [Pyrinomonadaceae bacterium]